MELEKFKQCGVSSAITHEKEYDYLDGVVYTPLGIVSVYSQGDAKHRKFSSFRCILNGEYYLATVMKRYSKLGLSRVAHKFIKQAFAEQEQKGE